MTTEELREALREAGRRLHIAEGAFENMCMQNTPTDPGERAVAMADMAVAQANLVQANRDHDAAKQAYVDALTKQKAPL